MTGSPTIDALIAIVGGLASLGAGIGGGLAYAKRQAPKLPAAHRRDEGDSMAPPETVVSGGPRMKRSEQIAILTGQAMADTWTRERAQAEAEKDAAVAQADYDRTRETRERLASLEKANGNHRVELALIGQRLNAVDGRLDSQHAVLSEVRDAVLRIEARAPVGVLRGGAAAPR